jgi:transketolase
MRSEAAAPREDARRTAGQRDLDKRCIDTIRTLAIDAVEKAQSGHAGAPMGLAPVAYKLWQRFLRYDPSDPLWPNRDRFVLSAGYDTFVEKILSAMRKGFGAHVEPKDRKAKPS